MIPVWGEVARDVPPLTRPGPEDWERLDVASAGSHVSGVRDLSTSRGADLWTGVVEAGRASARVDNRFGQLDGLKVRRRVRFVAQPEGEDPRVLWTGYIDRHPRKWGVNDSWRDLQCVGLLALIAERPLPPSVLQAETIASAPISYWPLTETSGRRADDVVGDRDGLWRLAESSNTQTLLPFDPRPAQTFGAPSKESLTVQAMSAPRVPVGAQITIGVWFRWLKRSTDSLLRSQPLVQIEVDSNRWMGIWAEPTSTTGPGRLLAYIYDGSREAWTWVESVDPFDGRPHLVTLSVEPALVEDPWASTAYVSVDGQVFDLDHRPESWFPSLVGQVGTLWVGDQLPASSYPPSSLLNEPQEWLAGHAAVWDRLLTPEEIEGLYRAGVQAWAGDTTGQRLHRVLDLAGIDPDDRLVDIGTQTCGPTFLGGNVRTYLEKLAATEQGSISEDAEGRIRFRQRPPNQPVPVAAYTGAPKDEPGVPYMDIELDDGIDRLVNIAQVTRENGVTHTATDQASEEEYGPVSVRLDTLHQSASGARSTAARLVIRNREPRQIITGLTVAGHDEVHVPAGAWLDIEIGDAVEVLCQPTGSTPFRQLSIVERIEHHARKTGERVMVLGLVEHQVLPCFALDDPDAGLDQSVMCEAPMEVA